MPLLSSITSRSITIAGAPGIPPDPEYTSLVLDASSYNEGDTITATLSTANIDDAVTVGYTVTGISANDLSSGSLSGNFTISSNSATASWTLSEDGLTEGTDTFVITLSSTDSAGNATGSLTRSASVLDTSFDPNATLWLDDGDNPVTVRQVIGGSSMQMNGVFAVNPTTPFNIEGRTSGTTTTVTNITANTGSYIEVDDTGNSTNFIQGEQLNLVEPSIGDEFAGGYYVGNIAFGTPTTTYRLIVAPISTETSLQFKTTQTTSSGAADSDDGFANTEALNTAEHPAASYTRALTTGGYTDWYLPTYLDKNLIVMSNSSLPAAQQLSNQQYWLSYTTSITDARIYNPVANTQGNATKTDPWAVRAVRRIPI